VSARLVVGLSALLCLLVAEAAPGAIPIPVAPAAAYSQTFDSIGATATAALPTNWKASKDAASPRTVGTWAAGVSATEQIAGNSMSTTATNGIYNYGAGVAASATDRAVGFVSSGSGTKNGNLYAYFNNSNAKPLSGVTISYDVEKYRGGSNSAGFRIQMYYSLDGSTWTSAGASFLTSFAADVNNNGFASAPGATASVSTQTLTAAIPALGDFYLAWNYSVSSGTTTTNAQGLGIDNFSILGNIALDPTLPTGTGSALPSSVSPGGATTLSVVVTPGANPTSTGLAVACSLTSIGGSATQAFANTSGTTFTYNATLGSAPFPWSRTIPCTITDSYPRNGTASIALTVVPPGPLHIHDVQGAAHLSPYNGFPGAISLLPAIVTAKNASGFWIEEPQASWDSDDSTSEAVYVYTGSAPTVLAGDSVSVTGTVQEYRPGSDPDRLTITEITAPSLSIVVGTQGNPLPPPVVIGFGPGKRLPPPTVIEDDATGSVETSGVFDPANDGIDFWESLEGMLVQVDNAVAVSSPWTSGATAKSFAVVADDASSSVRTPRGGIVVRDAPRDFNPEIIVLFNELAALPDVVVGDHFTSAVTGIIDSYDGYELKVTLPLTSVPGGLGPESTTPAGANELAIATFNVNNLSPTDPASKFSGLANVIVNNLKAPDLVAVEEVQDNNGTGAASVVDADQTWGLLISAIQAAGGPTYLYRQINPVYNNEGGASNGNIRTGFLLRTDRGLSFVDRDCGGCNLSTTPTAVVTDASGVHLDHSPGRVDPASIAWSSSSKSRPPLVGEFLFRGSRFFVVANHWVSKGADPGLYTPRQPLTLPSEPQRIAQAQVVNAFVGNLLAADPNADVVVLGDLNDFQFSPPLLMLKGSILNDLIETLPENQRYTYVYTGNSEALDHILLTTHLFAKPRTYQVVHVNSELMVRTSDHDPQVAKLALKVVTAVTIPVPEQDGVMASFIGGGPGCTFTNFAWVPLSAFPEPPPAGLIFRDGLFEFAVAGCTPGATLAFTLTTQYPPPAGAQYWKYGPTTGQGPHWYTIPATIGGTTVTFSITDGGLGDDVVGVQDGAIVEQGGVGANGPWADVPALDRGGMVALGILLAAAGAWLLAARRLGA
jgi:uncharacterized protein